jgi:hypothetical protein
MLVHKSQLITKIIFGLVFAFAGYRIAIIVCSAFEEILPRIIVAGFCSLFFFTGLINAIIGIKLMCGIVKNENLRKQLVNVGYSVMADVIKIERRGYPLNNARPYIIHCSCKEGFRELEFSSGAIYVDPTPNITEDNQIRVWIDRKDSKKYYIETA